jgi:imidazoleglycerol-phosphate dehydratase
VTQCVENSALAAKLFLGAEEPIKATEGLEVRDLDALADNLEVLLVAQPLDGALHGLDVEPDPARELHGRDGQVGGPGRGAGHLEEGADDLRLGVPKHQDLDLVLGVTEPPNELREDALGEGREALDDLPEGGAAEDEGRSLAERHRRRGARGAVEERAFAEEIAGAEDREAALDHADALEEPDAPGVEQVRLGRRIALAKEDFALREGPAILLEEEAGRSVDLLLQVDERVATSGLTRSRDVVSPRILRHGIDDRASARTSQTLAEAHAAWSNDPVTTGRAAREQRTTKETKIDVAVGLDGSGLADVETPLPFLSHMLEQIAKHGLVDLTVRAEGDVEIDGHHTTEDVAFTLGKAVAAALGDKAGIARYGSATLPMDEARATCAVDLSGRPYFVWEVPMPKAKLGTWDTELAEIFFEAFARGCMCNLHVVLHAGTNLHHMTEICFKAFAKALRSAAALDARAVGIPSTKGSL